MKFSDKLSGASRYGITIAVAGVGGVLGIISHLPIPWMLGPIFLLGLCSFYFSLRNQPHPFINFPNVILRYAIMIVGIFIGAKFESSILTRVQIVFPLVFLLVLSFLAVVPLGYYWLRRLGFNRSDALGSILPGAFTLIIVHMAQVNLSIKRVTVMHSVRIIAILVLTPFYFQTVLNVEIAVIAAPLTSANILDWVILFATAFSLGWIMDRFVPLHGIGFITTSLTATICYATEIVSSPPPDLLFNATLFVISVSIASRLAGLDFMESLKDLLTSFIMTVSMVGVAVILAWSLGLLMDYPFLAGVLALIPGGIHEVSLIAIIYNLDPVIIAFIHWLRVIAIAVSFPFLLRWVMSTSNRKNT